MTSSKDIAIIGMAGRFPDARTLRELHQNLRSGVDSIRPITEERVAATTLPSEAQYRRAGYLADVDKFDHAFFGIARGEAQAMDPLVRLLLEVVHETIENAGYAADALSGTRCAVIIGDASTEYYKHADGFMETLITGNSPSFFATRITKQFNLTGNAFMVNTACSSSHVALHMAVNEILVGEADCALVCGANLYLFPFYDNKNEMDVWSPDGKSRAFSEDANGMSNAEVIASVLLKPLDRAIADGDHIRAVIRGTAINNNANRSKSPYSPDSITQSEVIRLAWKKAGVTAHDIGFIETHGSGTQLGDMLEIEGLNKAFAPETDATKICPISAVKSNAGHGMSGAGLFSLIKTVLQLEHREIFPTLHVERLNPLIDFERSAVYVNRELVPWTGKGDGKRIAGVTSLGASGTNVHVVVEEAPPRTPTPERTLSERGQYLVAMSARNDASLAIMRNELREFLARERPRLADVAYTLGVGRRHYDVRSAIVASSLDELIGALETVTATASSRARVLWLVGEPAGDPTPLLEALCASPRFAAHVETVREALGVSDLRDPRAAALAIGYAAFKTLTDYGLPLTNVVPIGVGGLALQAARSETVPTDLAARLRALPSASLANLDERAAKLVAAVPGTGPLVCIDLTGESAVLEAIRRALAGDTENAGRVISIAQPGAECTMTSFLAELYRAGLPLDWGRLSEHQRGDRIGLPSYVFTKTRCWLRERPRRAAADVELALFNDNEAYLPVEERSALDDGGSEIELTIAGFWCEELDRDSVRSTDNFFEIGGDSLRATKVIGRVNRHFASEVEFEDLYDHATVKELAALVLGGLNQTEKVALVWREVLKVDTVAPSDNFFDLGGHSLLASQVIVKLRVLVGVEIDFDEFYSHPTLDEFTRYVGQKATSVRPKRSYAVTKTAPRELYPTSSAQRRLWVLSQLDEGTLAYNSTVAMEIRGAVDATRLARALQAVVDRHESLRTVFVEIDGKPWQKILPLGTTTAYEVVDLTAETNADARAASIVAREEWTAFDLAAGPLMRTLLVRLERQRSVLVVTMHHTISDGWSAQVFAKDLLLAYEAFTRGLPNPLGALPFQYKDFACWIVDEQSKTRAWQDAEAYWLDLFAGEVPVIELPTDRPRSALQTFRGKTLHSVWRSDFVRRIEGVCRAQKITLYAFLVGAVNVLLQRHTAQDDIVVGSVSAGRVADGLEDQIGCYVNTFALRTHLDADEPASVLLRRVGQSALRSVEHSIYPFDSLVEKLTLRRDPSRSALFDVLVVLQNITDGRQTLRAGELSFAPFGFERGVSQFDITFEFETTAAGLELHLQYNTELFDEERMVRLQGHLRTLAQGIVDAPESPLFRLPLLTQAETEALASWNDTPAVPLGPESAIHPTFVHAYSDRVVRSPDAPAVSWVDGNSRGTFTYREFDARVAAIAAALRETGAPRESVVALLGDRGPDLMIAIVGVLSAGLAYIPLDPGHPPARLRQILDEAGARFAIASSSHREALAQCGYAFEAVLDMKVEPSAATKLETGREALPDGLAYVIFTSGSTGVPKGAMVEHRGMLNHLHAKVAELGLTASDVVAQTASQCFDISVWQFLVTTMSGGRVHVLSDDIAHDPNALLDRVATDGVTVLEVVPSMLRALLDELELRPTKPSLAKLRWMVATGEALPPDLCERWFAACPTIPLLNAYGPTECSDDVTHFAMHEAPKEEAFPLGNVPIGFSLANNALYVLDRHAMPVPHGVPGELYIGGTQVGRGYLGRPDLTADRFVPCPFSPEPGARMYRSGDLVQRRADGAIEFLGRIDHQVKVRGFRIELGEIELALRGRGGVRDVAVIVREDRPGDKRIVAYVVREASGRADDLSALVRENLPSYMVPSAFVVLDALPLTPNGKIDRKALPAPDADATDDRTPYVAPRSDVERLLAEVWTGVLGVDGVGVHHNFFELGGDSILAMQVVSRAAARGLRVTPKQLFQAQTIADLAPLAEAVTRIVGEQGLVTGELPLTPIVQGFLESHTIDRDHYNQAVFLELPRGFDVAPLEEAVRSLVEHHDILRVRVHAEASGAFRARIVESSPPPFVTTVDLSRMADDALPSAIERAATEIQASLDLEKGPVFRFARFDLGPNRSSRLLIVIHHAAVDGVSWRILLEDLASASRALAAGQPPQLPPKTTSFVAWAERIHRYASSPELEAETAFWTGLPWASVHPFPKDADVASHVGDADSVAIELTVEETTLLLRSTVQAYRLQINDVLLTALVSAFAQWTGSSTLLLDLESHGREELFNDVDISRTVGWFTAIFPVLLTLPQPFDAGEALKSIKEQLRAIPNRGVGFGILKELHPGVAGDQLRALPKPDIIFNYLGQFDQLAGDAGFSAAPEASGPTVSLRARRHHAFELSAMVLGGAFSARFDFDPRVHAPAVAQRIADGFTAALRELIAHGRSADAYGFTPSDFALVRPLLAQSTLDALLTAQGGARGIEDIYPLSPLQQGLAFHSSYSVAGRDPYFNQFTCRLPLEIDQPTLIDAWQTLLARHSCLRTSFVMSGLDGPLQVVHRSLAMPIEQLDWQELEDDAVDSAVDAFMLEERARGFRLDQAPLTRVALIRSRRDVRLVWSFHHLLLDGWSLPILFNELFTLYHAQRTQTTHELPVRRPFRDHIAWLAQQDRSQAEAFWRGALAGFTSPTSFDPKPRALSHGDSLRGEAVRTLSKETTDALAALARKGHVTINTLVQGAWSVLLSAYSGSAEVVFGATVAGRPGAVAGVDAMVGLFINTIPVRVTVSPASAVGAWLQALQEQQVDLRRFEHSPLIDIQAWSSLPPRTALFDSIVVFENYPIESSLLQVEDAMGIAIDGVRFLESSNYPVTLVVAPGNELGFKLNYDRERFDAVWAEALLSRLEHVLASFEHLERRVGALNVATSAEQEALLAETTSFSPSEDAVVARYLELLELRPRANANVYVTSHEGRLLPSGLPGELWIGGVGRESIDDPRWTAESFVPDPFSVEPGARAYRTGDLVRRRSDGAIEVLGRVHIDVGAIEAELRRHAGVRDVAVVVREDRPQGKRIVAYVVCAHNAGDAHSELAAFVRGRLPETLWPSAFVVLDALPLGANGAVDREALPAPGVDASAETGTAYVAPRTDVERILASAWAEVLGVERVGVDHDFFDLGGDSMLAFQVVNRAAAGGVHITLNDIFEALTISELASLAGDGGGGNDLVRVTRDSAPPLSFAQQRLWFLDQLQPGRAFYNIPMALEVRGRLDVDALALALRFLQERHESLRTTFVAVDGVPYQTISAAGTLELRVRDVGPAEATALALEDAQRPFDLQHGPLLRATLLRTAADQAILSLTIHHSVSDEWSSLILARDLSTAYFAFARGGVPELPELTIQYADFAAWQRAWLQGQALDAELAWWKRALDGAPLVLDLPFDRPRPTIQEYRGKKLEAHVPKGIADSVLALARSEGATTFMVLLAAFDVLLAKYSGQNDIVVGSPISGRTHRETEELIGFFVNTVVLRASVDAHRSFRSLLQQVRTTALAAYEHQHVPFEKLVEELQPARDTSRSPIFQVMFVLQNDLPQAIEGSELEFSVLSLDNATAKFDLTLLVQESDQGFDATFEFDTDLFDLSTIERMAGHFVEILDQLSRTPDASLGAVSLVGERERQHLLQLSQGPRREPVTATESVDPHTATFVDLFLEQAKRTPDAIAVSWPDGELSFRQLEERTANIAASLAAHRLPPESVVALLDERGPMLLGAILGALRAGYAYLPLDPLHPPARLRQILDAAQPQSAIVGAAFRSLLQETQYPFAATLDMADDASSMRAAVAALSGKRPGPSQLAYVIFTSGSTGVPKGAMVEHRGMLNHLFAKVDDLGLTEKDVVAQTASQCFDISVWQYLVTLLGGGRTHVLPDAIAHDPKELLLAVERGGVTILEVVPSMLRALLDEIEQQPRQHTLSSLRWVIATGEALPPDLCARWFEAYPEIPLLNAYGPTECSDDVTHFAMTSAPASRITPIGFAIRNTNLYVMSPDALLLPVGVPGELWVGGEGVGRGYIREAARTADVFVPDPFSSVAGARLYRTGDLVRRRVDGVIEFLGRIDHQVKLRGFRIELGEIELALRAHAKVSDVVVIVREDRPGDKRLVAYVVAEDLAGGDLASELSTALRNTLPDYMIPSAFVGLDALPLTANGKLDRNALPIPGEHADMGSTFVAPRGPVEQSLVEIWAGVLGIERVGIHDNFFELGGHSLLATQVVSRIRSTLSRELPLRAIFEKPTVARLATALEASAVTTDAFPLTTVRRDAPIAVSFAQARLWFLDQLEPGSVTYNMPVAVRLRGQLDVAALQRAFVEIVRRHESLRTTFVYDAGQVQQVVRDDVEVALQLVALDALDGDARDEALLQHMDREAATPFDLTRGPLLRGRLVTLAADHHVLLFTMHHIVSDGWSMGLVVTELGTLYAAFSRALPSPLAPLAFQYPDFAAWQRQWLESGEMQRQLDYWRAQLSGAPPSLELPTDKLRPPVFSSRGRTLEFVVPRELTDRLRELAMREGATLFMVLLAAFDVLLARYSGQNDIVVGTPVANRTRRELEPLIGFFVNTLVLRAKLDRGASFESLLESVKKTTLDAYAHQDVPFERVVESLSPPRDGSRTPLFQVMFALQNAPDGAVQLPGVTLDVLSFETHIAKFDLTLTMVEDRDGKLAASFEYATDLFEHATIERMAEHLLTLLRAVADAPTAKLSEHSLLSDRERHTLLVAWNDTATSFPRDESIHQPFEEQEAFFREMLGAIDAPTAPFDLLDVESDGRGLAEAQLTVDERVARRLRAQAAHLGVMPASLWHQAWALVLARLTGRSDVVFGTVLFGRTLPVAAGVGEESIEASVRRMHVLLGEVLRHGHAPLALALRCSGVPAPLPLFTTLLNVRQDGVASLPRDEQTNYPVTVLVDDLGQGFAITAQVDASVDAGRVCGLLQAAVEGLVTALESAPETPARQIDVLPASERERVVETWNQVQAADAPWCLHERFEAQVRATPEAVALTFGPQAVTYGALNARANRLAHRLRTLGVGPEVRVAICAERGVELVVAILAVLKAGGAYVPLDPSYPLERLRATLRDSEPRALLVTGTLLADVSSELPVVDLGDDLSGEAETNPSGTGVRARDVAYVIYTSGSTGIPKGVMVEHRQVARLFASTQGWFAFGARDVWTLFHSYAFDFSVWEIWGALLHGGRLVVVPKDTARSADDFYDLCCRERVTVLNQTPSAFRKLMTAQSQSMERHALRTVILGGEALEVATLRPWYEQNRAGSTVLVNMYGITETTVHVTYRALSAEDVERGGSPIGHRIPDLSIYILDAWGRPCPIGVVGELYVGGAGVARGYWKRPELTTERFMSDRMRPGERVYRTGDLGRWLADGSIEYVGRNDEQVKIRGFRIELGEIASRLLSHRDVRESVVVAREDAGGDRRLVAYVTSQGGRDIAVEELRAHLSSQLPEYMVPTAIVRLEQLPLTPNGKLDRAALPAPDGTAYGARTFEAPQGAREEALAAIWSELLDVDPVGRADNFFALGGYSLLAVSLVERMRRAGLPSDVRTVFAEPTLAGLAATIGDGAPDAAVVVPPNGIPDGCQAITPDMLPLVELSAEEIARIVAAVPGGAANVQDIYPLAPLQEGILFHHLLAGNGDAYLLTTQLAFDTREHVNRFVAALQAVVDRHDILRTSVVWEGLREPVQVVWRRAVVPVEEVQLEPGDDGTARLRDRFDPRRYRLDLRQAPMLRLCVAFDAASDRWLMAVLLHHFIDDNSSQQRLLTEIEDHLAGRADHLPATIPFRNLVAQVRLGVSNDEHEAFFRRLLGDIDEPTAPYGLLDVHGDGSGIAEKRIDIDARLVARLRERARRLGVTFASLLHHTWAQLLARVTGRDDVVFGTVLFGRTQGGAGTDRGIGPFINTLPLRVSIGDASIAKAVRQTHTVLAELMRHEHATLVLAQRCSAVAPPLPLFTSILNVRHRDRGRPPSIDAWQGMDVLESEERTSYPLSLSVDDLGDRLRLTAQVDARIDPARVINLMVTALGRIADALETAPETPARALDVLPAAERSLVVETWNRTERPIPAASVVHELVAAQVARTPDAIAVAHDAISLTYRELDARAEGVAARLRALGIGPDVLVAVGMPRSIGMIVTVLAIAKVGAASLPLDADYPAARLTYMLEDSAAEVVVTTQALQSRFPEHVLAITVDSLGVVDSSEEGRGVSRTNLPRRTRADDLLYVIYTSGSTGRPKGVAVTHRCLSDLVLWQRERDTGRASKRTLQFTSLSFDVSFQEIFLTLSTGGALHLVDDEIRRDPALLRRVLTEQKIERLFLPFVALQQLAQAIDAPQAVPSLKQVITAGEALHVTPDIARMFGASGRTLENQYGPSETHVATAHELSGHADSWGAAPPIGRPVANTAIYLVDRDLRLVPLGAVGELLIGGPRLARGYWHRPGLTAEKFVPDPFSSTPGARLYRTGDLARWNNAGELEYLGRLDHQVKVRGFRIELGEIEASLLRVGAVREAVVVARPLDAGHKQLVAYVVLKEGESFDIETVRAHLKVTLPEYMVPSAFVVLDALPFTPSGKVDRKELPLPEIGLAIGTYAAPRNTIEDALCTLFADVLHAPRIGIHDNFFELGGHSLLATQLISRIRSTLSRELPLRTVFEEPTVARLAGALAASAMATDAFPLTTVQRGAPIAVSFAQERLWFLDQLEPGSVTYNMPVAVRLRGQLDVTALQRAFAEIVRRHNSLRTTFVHEAGQVQQVVRDDMEVALQLVALDALDGDARDEALLQHMDREAATPFDLARGPLLRAQLLSLAADHHVLLFTMHHIVSDGWSMGLLVTELGALYAAFSRALPSPLAPLAFQYPDFAAWQRQWLESGEMQRQLDYWRAQLSGAPPSLELPTDKLRPPVFSSRGRTLEFVVPRELTIRLRELAMRKGATLFMVLLAAFDVLLARYSGQNDIVVGTPIANRTRRELEPLIGFFVNTLVLRAKLDSAASFESLVESVKKTTLDAYAHQDVPFERVVEVLSPPRDASRTPLFQVMFALQNAPDGDVRLPGVTLEALSFEMHIAKFDLSLAMVEDRDGKLAGSFEYGTDLFEHATIERMAEHLLTLLRAVTDAPTAKLSEHSLLSDRERHTLLVAWNDTTTSFPRDKTIHRLFEEHVERTPGAIALVFEDEQLSYRELNARANQLAHRLRREGVGPDVLVAVCIERSVEMMVAILAVLKAGGAYVPIDLAYPKERIAYVLRDANAPLVLASEVEHPRLPPLGANAQTSELARCRVLRLGPNDREKLALESRENLAPTATALNLAYVMYTSGSTGGAKGVGIPHRGAVRLVRDNPCNPFGPENVFLQLASIAFDGSVTEMWGPLLNGGRVVVFPPGPFTMAELSETIRARGINILILTTAIFHQFVDEHVEVVRGLKRLMVGGDILSPAHVHRVQREAPGVPIVNLYGPTENSVFTTTYEVEGPIDRTVSIGRAVGNTQVYVLDARLDPVPVGVWGELYTSGDGLARGYWNRPDLTAEKFLPNPFSTEPGTVLYRTGDAVRYRPDGNIEFLGRLDHQVKFRGFRIELDEIEQALRVIPAVRDATVLLREDQPGHKRIVAYVALNEPASNDELSAALKAALPDYMIPSAYVRLDALPLTANGKTDKRALPVPDQPFSTTDYAAPRGPLEQALVEIWESVLSVPRVGIHDNFFELGGHSLLATQVVSRIRATLNRELPLRTIFGAPTVAQLATALAGDPQRSDGVLMRLSTGTPGQRPLFFVHGAGGSALVFAHLARHVNAMPFYGLSAPDTEEDLTAERLGKLYVDAIREVQPRGPYVLGGWSVGGVIAFEMARQLERLGERIELVLLDSFAPRADEPLPDELGILAAFSESLGTSWKDMRLDLERVMQLSGIDRWNHVLECARSSGVQLPPLVDGPESLARLYTRFERLCRLPRRYAPEPISVPTLLVAARTANTPADHHDDHGWDRLRAGARSDQEIEGDHYSMLQPPRVARLARILIEHVSNAAEGSNEP